MPVWEILRRLSGWRKHSSLVCRRKLKRSRRERLARGISPRWVRRCRLACNWFLCSSCQSGLTHSSSGCIATTFYPARQTSENSGRSFLLLGCVVLWLAATAASSIAVFACLVAVVAVFSYTAAVLWLRWLAFGTNKPLFPFTCKIALCVFALLCVMSALSWRYLQKNWSRSVLHKRSLFVCISKG